MVKIDEILDSNRYELFEIVGSLSVAISRCVINKHKVYIWGARENIDAFIRVLKFEKVDIGGIIDIDQDKWGENVDGIKIVSPIELFSTDKNSNVFVFFWTKCFFGNSQEKLISDLMGHNVRHWYNITTEDYHQICYYTNHNHRKYYKENRDIIGNIMDRLYDEESIKCYAEYMRTYIENSTWRLPECATSNKYFYGGSLEDKEELYIHYDDEVWLNCGCHVGDTVFNYFRHGLSAKKIYAVDGDTGHINMFRDNMSYLPPEYQKMISLKNIFIDKNTDCEKVFEGEKLTLINADIEGAELGLIQDLSDLIKKDRPVIALCLYHKVTDVVEIPQFLMNNLDDYTYYVRKYPSYYKFSYRNFELVLYAVPNERMPR